jgi:hypothetical protein
MLMEENVTIKTFDPNFNSQEKKYFNEVISVWENGNSKNTDKKKDTFEGFYVKDCHIEPNSSYECFNITNRNRINELKFDINHLTLEELDKIDMKIYWDGEEDPSVSMSLARFFFQNPNIHPKLILFESLLFSVNDTILSATIPMDFEAFRMVMTNNNNKSINLVVNAFLDDQRINNNGEINEGTLISHGKMRFKARSSSQQFKYGTVFKPLEVRNKGLFVATHLATKELTKHGNTEENFSQEGNEYFYVDHEKDPVWLGTGTEDYFNCAYYYKYGQVAAPTHGCLYLVTDPKNHNSIYGKATMTDDRKGVVSAYRFHGLDAVPFEERFTFILEAGCPKKGALAEVNGIDDVLYQWTVFWYETSEKDNRFNLNNNDVDLHL